MVTREEAIKSVRGVLPSEFDVVCEKIVERDYGWVIPTQTKRFIESGNFGDMAIGHGLTLVEKVTGKLVKFGSAFSLEDILHVYEAGYLAHESWDIVIDRVLDEREAANLLTRLGLSYVIPEVEGGVTWRIPRTYTVKELQSYLSKLPCRLHLGSAYPRWRALDSLRQSKSLKFQLVVSEGPPNEV